MAKKDEAPKTLPRRFPKKITTKACGFNVTLCEKLAKEYGKDAPVKVLKVYGTVESSEKATSNFGEYHRFKGNCAAVNLVDSVMYRAGSFILPEVAETALLDRLSSHKASGSTEACTFGMYITVQYVQPQNEKSTEFTWGCEPIIQDASADPLAAIADLMGPTPALPFNG